LNLNKPLKTPKIYNYSNDKDIFIVSHYISVYAEHAVDKKLTNSVC